MAGDAGGFPRRPGLVAGSNVTIVGGWPNQRVSAGALINWTEGVTNGTSPNAAIPVVNFTPLNAAVNVDSVIAVKGTGSFMVQVPDATTAGGNKRGTNAVDFQFVRTLATQVASGNNTALIACDTSVAGGFNAIVAGGANNQVSASYCAVLGGSGNKSSTGSSVCLGGSNNTASGTGALAMGATCTSSANSSIGGGRLSIASANYGIAFGDTCTSDAIGAWASGAQSITRGLVGSRAHSVGKGGFGQGDDQEMRMFLIGKVLDATPTILTTDKAAAGNTNQYALTNLMSSTVRGIVTAREGTTGTGNTASWEFVASIRRGANAAATVMVTACTPTLVAADAGASTWTLGVAADTTNGALKITFTGQALTTVIIGATLTAVEITL